MFSVAFFTVVLSVLFVVTPATQPASQPADAPMLDPDDYMLRPPATKPAEFALESPTPSAATQPAMTETPTSQPVTETQPLVETQPARLVFAPTPTPIPIRGYALETPAVPTASPAPTATPYQPLPPDFSHDQVAEVLRRDLPTNRPLLPQIPEDYRYRTETTAKVESGRPPVIPTRLLREGEIITDRRARIVKDPDGGYSLAFEREGPTLRMPPIKLLPNQLLEQVLAMSGGTDERVFDVSGVVTRFEGRNYLLLQRVSPAADMGNLR